MIVSFLREFVYLGVPKTAGTSLHEWLSQPIYQARGGWRGENGLKSNLIESAWGDGI